MPTLNTMMKSLMIQNYCEQYGQTVVFYEKYNGKTSNVFVHQFVPLPYNLLYPYENITGIYYNETYYTYCIMLDGWVFNDELGRTNLKLNTLSDEQIDLIYNYLEHNVW